MKRILNFKFFAWCVLIISLACVFISCDLEKLSLTYFKCQLNGERYKTYNGFISFASPAEPVFKIGVRESTMTYSFFTTISPEDANSDKPRCFLSLLIYSEEPLKIGEKYFIANAGEAYPEWSMGMEPIRKDYVWLYIPINGYFHKCYGSGTFKLTEYNDKEKWYKGTVEFEFDLPIEEEGKNGKTLLIGEFCAVDY